MNFLVTSRATRIAEFVTNRQNSSQNKHTLRCHQSHDSRQSHIFIVNILFTYVAVYVAQAASKLKLHERNPKWRSFWITQSDHRIESIISPSLWRVHNSAGAGRSLGSMQGKLVQIIRFLICYKVSRITINSQATATVLMLVHEVVHGQ